MSPVLSAATWEGQHLSQAASEHSNMASQVFLTVLGQDPSQRLSLLENLPLEFSGSLGLSLWKPGGRDLCLGLNASVLQLQYHRLTQVGGLLRHLFLIPLHPDLPLPPPPTPTSSNVPPG